jgi:hypothetical protein
MVYQAGLFASRDGGFPGSLRFPENRLFMG